MKISRLWAQVKRKTLAYMAVAFFGLSTAMTVGAQPENWEYPGRYSFQGTPEQACQLLTTKTNISFAECLVGVAKLNAEQCREVFLQDGDTVATTFTRWNGTHLVRIVVVAFKYPLEHELAGESLPADHPDRKALSCSTGNADGLAILLPAACKNWSVHQMVLPPESSARLVCRQVSFSAPVHSEVGQYLNSIWVGDCCCSGDSYLPSFGFNLTDSLESNGYSEICDWE